MMERRRPKAARPWQSIGAAAGLAVTLVACLIAPLPASAQTATQTERAGPLKVAVRQSPPFAFHDGDGRWDGLSVALWRQTAERLGLEYEWVETPLKDTIGAVADGQIDVAITALSITPEREERVDFSHPYYISGLARGYPAETSGWVATLLAFASLDFLSAVGSLLLVLLVAGFLVWLFERRENAEEFGRGSVARGLGDGLWWSAVTMTTVGYGDKAPKTLGGRVVGLIWMFVSLIIIASFTASIAASLTTNRLANEGARTSPIASLTVATVAESNAAAYAARQGGRVRTYPALPEAIRAVQGEEADVVVYDAPILKYWARREFAGIAVGDALLIRDDYGFAVAEGDPLRERINAVILDVIGGAEWQALKQRFFGDADPL